MSVSLIPGIYSSYEIRSSVAGGRRAGLIGLAAAVSTAAAAEPVEIRSFSAAASIFGAGSNMTKLIRVLMQNGAAAVLAVPVLSGDYAGAFASLMSDGRVAYMLCDSRDAEVHAAMKSAIAGANEASKYRIGIVEAEGNSSQLVTKAQSLNYERMVLCGNREPSGGTPGSAAAALAGLIASSPDPAVPLNGSALKGLSGLAESYTDAQLTALIAGGVTPVAYDAGEHCVVRGVTTRTATAGEPDSSWREINTVLIIDDVIPTVRSSLKKSFTGSKNNARTRGAVRTQVIIELEDKLRKEIIESYGDVSVTADSSDPTLCVVSFGFTVAHGLNSISLEACITV